MHILSFLRSCIPALLRSHIRLFTFLLFYLFTFSSCSFVAEYFEHQDEEDPTPATLIWSDEFEGAELDTTKWHYRGLGPRRDAINVREAVSLDGNGHLLITTSRSGDEIHTGMIGTEDTFQHTYGYWEARLRFQKQKGHWSAFWIQSPDVGKVGDPAVNGVEIDVIEWMTNKRFLAIHNLHWDGYGDDHKHVGKKVPFLGLDTGFHTVAVDWQEDSYTFYVDGQETWKTETAVSQRNEYAILSLEVGDWAGDIQEAILPDTLFVDYVRVYDKKP